MNAIERAEQQIRAIGIARAAKDAERTQAINTLEQARRLTSRNYYKGVEKLFAHVTARTQFVENKVL